MSTLEVPDFKTAVDFQNWVYLLKEKDIQSWTTQDWNKMYDKVNAFIEASPELEDDLIRIHGTQAHQWDMKTRMALKRSIFMDSPMNSACMIKLNSNYCPEKAQIELMRSLADDAAEKLAEKYKSYGTSDLVSINIPTTKNQSGSILRDAALAMKEISYEQTQIPQVLYEHGKNINNYSAMVFVQDKLDDGSLGVASKFDGKPEVSLSNSRAAFEFQESQSTAWHEFAHAHFQQAKDLGSAGENVLPLPQFGDDFYQLMHNNQDFYVSTTRIAEIQQSRHAYMLEESSLNGFNGYHKQPREWFSNYYGARAEHKFRELTGQKSERSASHVASYLEEYSDLGKPDDAFFKDGKVHLVYNKPDAVVYEKGKEYLLYERSADQGFGSVERTLDKAFEKATPELRQHLSTVTEADGVHVIISPGYEVSHEIQNLRDVAGPLSQSISQSRSMFDTADMGLKNIAKEEQSAVAQVSNSIHLKAEQSAKKMEDKLAEKSANQSTEKAIGKATTKSALRVQAASAARKIGSSTTKVGTKAKSTVKVAGKATKETLLAINRAYDDSFDALMKWGNTHSPQWMNRLEEATVQKAAESFMNTSSGQAIAKQIEKKVGKEAAVSVAKKIPVLCLVVGVTCVYDRLKEGEYLKALGEGASAIASNIPGYGTLASMGLNGAMLSDDLKVFEQGIMPKDPNSHMVAENTGYDNQLKRMNEVVDRQTEEAKAQKEKNKAFERKATAEMQTLIKNLRNVKSTGEISR